MSTKQKAIILDQSKPLRGRPEVYREMIEALPISKRRKNGTLYGQCLEFETASGYVGCMQAAYRSGYIKLSGRKARKDDGFVWRIWRLA